MPRSLVSGIYLLLLPRDGEGSGWIHFLRGGSVEDEGDNYSVSILTSMIWRLLFPDDDIKMEMVSPPWNNFLCLFSILSWLDLASMKDLGD